MFVKSIPKLPSSSRMMIMRAFSIRPTAPVTAEALHFKIYPKTDEHFKEQKHVALKTGEDDKIWDNPIPHPVYSTEELESIEKTHRDATKMHERVALFAVRALRTGFDIVSRYKGPGGEMTKMDWLHRCLFLETVAGVPGMVAGMARHLRSLRTMQRDNGWIHTLLEEAENERMHLLIFMNMKKPGILFRTLVLGGQGVFFNAFFLTYLISPRTCHRFVGYLEEEAVKTYSGLLKDIEEGHLKGWDTELAPLIGRKYYKLGGRGTVFDMIKCIRADEANHRDVNHTFADLEWKRDVNPFIHKHAHGAATH